MAVSAGLVLLGGWASADCEPEGSRWYLGVVMDHKCSGPAGMRRTVVSWQEAAVALRDPRTGLEIGDRWVLWPSPWTLERL